MRPPDRLTAVALRYHHVYFTYGRWQETTWRGVRLEKSPLDLQAYHEAIYEVKPDWIIEGGTRFGGSALFFADQCELMGHGKVITIDVKQPGVINHPRVIQIEGSTLAPATLAELERLIQPGDKVFVSIDDDHRVQHVAVEIEVYSKFVTPGSYLVIEDSFPTGAPTSYFEDAQPILKNFVARNPEFSIQPDKYPGGFSMLGWLRRAAP